MTESLHYVFAQLAQTPTPAWGDLGLLGLATGAAFGVTNQALGLVKTVLEKKYIGTSTGSGVEGCLERLTDLMGTMNKRLNYIERQITKLDESHHGSAAINPDTGRYRWWGNIDHKHVMSDDDNK